MKDGTYIDLKILRKQKKVGAHWVKLYFVKLSRFSSSCNSGRYYKLLYADFL